MYKYRTIFKYVLRDSSLKSQSLRGVTWILLVESCNGMYM